VHFSILQEYIATNAGFEMGRMFQISNNYHAYVSEIEKLQKRGGYVDLLHCLYDDRYHRMEPQPLVDHPKDFDEELMNMGNYGEPFFHKTFSPMMWAWDAWKSGEDPFVHLDNIEAEDWREACTEWMVRRKRVN
jgi:hypothetical protein